MQSLVYAENVSSGYALLVINYLWKQISNKSKLLLQHLEHLKRLKRNTSTSDDNVINAVITNIRFQKLWYQLFQI